MINHQIVVGVIIALIAALKLEPIVGFFTGRRKNTPRIEFELERVDPISGHENLTFVFKVVNVEGGVASDLRCIWTRRSTCTMTPVPQPFMLMFDEPRRFEFAVNMADLVLGGTRTQELRRLG